MKLCVSSACTSRVTALNGTYSDPHIRWCRVSGFVPRQNSCRVNPVRPAYQLHPIGWGGNPPSPPVRFPLTQPNQSRQPISGPIRPIGRGGNPAVSLVSWFLSFLVSWSASFGCLVGSVVPCSPFPPFPPDTTVVANPSVLVKIIP